MTELRKDSSKRVVCAALCIAIILLCTLLGGAFVIAGAEGKTVLQNGSVETLETVYAPGDTFALPTDVEISDGKNSFAASVILRDPSGNGYDAAEVTLTKAGMYTLEYRANGSGGALLTAKQQFSCLNPLLGTSSERSSAQYVSSKELHNNITGGAGIELSIAKGDSFTYNQIIDLSNASVNDRLVTFYVAPQTLYEYDAGAINFVFTDAFDQNNTVTVTVKRTLLVSVSDMEHYSYVTANSAQQQPTGVNLPVQSAYPTVTVDGVQHNLHVGNAYGRAVPHSMYGGHGAANDAASYLGKQMSISFDYELGRVYAWGISDSSPRLVADLDDPAQFDNVWSGFQNGKVILSVNMSSYRSLSSNIVITNIAGDDLTQDYARDRFAPSISVDLAGYGEDNLPQARVGSEYPLFDAVAVDETDGEVICDASVWYNYASEQTRTRVTTNGNSFTPTQEGVYTVVYSATDYSGNVSNRAYDVTAAALGDLTLSYTPGESSIAAGKPYTLKDVALTGGSGEKLLSVTAVSGSTRYELVGNGSDYSFVPLVAGNYTVTFAYSDRLQQKTETVPLTVTSATGAYIPGEAAVPRYVHSGATYDVPQLSGYAFGGNLDLTACTVSATGAEISGKTMRITAESGEIVLTYTLAMSGGDSDVKTYRIPVVAGSGIEGERTLDMSKFFAESNYAVAPGNYARVPYSVEFTENNFNGRAVFTAKNTSADNMAYAAIDFTNKVLASRLETEFRLGTNAQFMRVSVYVTDSVNSNQRIKVTFANGGGWKMNFSVNDGYSYATSYTGSTTVEFGYNEQTNVISTGGSINAPITTYYGGGAFEGFSSGFVYLTYQIEGLYTVGEGVAETTAQVQINRINNQVISATRADNVDPQVTEYVSRGDLPVGTVETIPAFTVCDVINPYTAVSVSVVAPSGDTVVSVDGVALDGTQDISRSYEILLDEYGSYSIRVRGTVGAAGSEFTANYGIQVLDMSAPEITFIDAVTTAKVGDTVAFAGVSVTDDKTPAADIVVSAYLMAPNGQITTVNIAQYGSFVATEAGEYRLYIRAADEGNMYGSTKVPNTAVAWYAITVTA